MSSYLLDIIYLVASVTFVIGVDSLADSTNLWRIPPNFGAKKGPE